MKNKQLARHGKGVQFHLIIATRKIGPNPFFTCFRNHVQASEKEKALLQLLVLRQVGINGNMTIDEAGQSLGVDVEAIKAKFKATGKQG